MAAAADAGVNWRGAAGVSIETFIKQQRSTLKTIYIYIKRAVGVIYYCLCVCGALWLWWGAMGLIIISINIVAAVPGRLMEEIIIFSLIMISRACGIVFYFVRCVGFFFG